MSDEAKKREPSPDFGTLKDPTIHDLAPLVGLLNTHIGERNENVVGDSGLASSKIGADTVRGIIQPGPQQAPVVPPAQQHASQPSPFREPRVASVPVTTVAPSTAVSQPVTINKDSEKKINKKISSVQRRVRCLEKEIEAVQDIVSFEHKSVKYSIQTDTFQGTCNDTKALLSLVLKDLQNNTQSITIQRI
jgi:hypothetical protein